MDLEPSSGLSLLSCDGFVFEGKGRGCDLQAAAGGPARVRHPAETFPSLPPVTCPGAQGIFPPLTPHPPKAAPHLLKAG